MPRAHPQPRTRVWSGQTEQQSGCLGVFCLVSPQTKKVLRDEGPVIQFGVESIVRRMCGCSRGTVMWIDNSGRTPLVLSGHTHHYPDRGN